MIRSKRSRFISLLFVFATLSCSWTLDAFGQASDPVTEARRLMFKGDYTEAQSLLLQATLQPDAMPVQKAAAYRELAVMYHDAVGQEELAEVNWQLVLQQPLAQDHVLRAEALKAIAAIGASREQYREALAILETLTVTPTNAAMAEANIARLKPLVELPRDFPGAARARVYLGANLLGAGHPGAALRSFADARRLAPGIGRQLPVAAYEQQAKTAFAANEIPRWGSILILGVLLLGLVMTCRSHPGQWFRWRHARVLLLVIAGWCVLFLAVAALLQHTGLAPTTHGMFMEPQFVKLGLFARGGKRLVILMGTGILTLVAMALVSIGTARWRSSLGRLVFTLLAGLLVSGASTGMYYVRYCTVDTYVAGTSLQARTVFMFIEPNKSELPDDPAVLQQMLANANPAERAMIEALLEDIRSGFHAERMRAKKLKKEASKD